MASLTAEDKEYVLLAIFAGMNGKSDVSDDKWCWMNWFCNDEKQTASKDDTFNRCCEKGWLKYYHNSDFDTGMAELTPAGRAVLESKNA